MTKSSEAKSADAKPSSSLNNSPSNLTYYHSKNFRSAYSPPVKVSISFSGPGLTRQEFKEECDINNILKQYDITGVLTHINNSPPIYADVSSYDYQEAMDLVASAQSMFHGLPSTIRNRFDNDPAKLLEFVQDPSNRAEAISLGLVNPDPQPTPTNAPAAILEPSRAMQPAAPSADSASAPISTK